VERKVNTILLTPRGQRRSSRLSTVMPKFRATAVQLIQVLDTASVTSHRARIQWLPIRMWCIKRYIVFLIV